MQPVIDSSEAGILTLKGSWVLAQAKTCENQIKNTSARAGAVALKLAGIEALDTAGIALLRRLTDKLRKAGAEVTLQDRAELKPLLLEDELYAKPDTTPSRPVTDFLARIGKGFYEAFDEAREMLSFLGEVTLVFGSCLRKPKRFRIISIIHNLEQTGVNALPIVGLIAILTSIVLAYQSVTQLQKFGAEIFMIDLIGISVLREMAVLLTAIIVAGRSGSAFAAQIGTMQVGEEIDALRTMGMNPVEVLVIPRVVALLIALPILTFFADLMGLAGGALMARGLLDISLDQYLSRLQTAIVPWTFGVGLVKAPVFAILIAMIGCMEGMKVSGSAESVGRQTTRAVVVAIFVIIIADALFSILFSKLGI